MPSNWTSHCSNDSKILFKKNRRKSNFEWKWTLWRIYQPNETKNIKIVILFIAQFRKFVVNNFFCCIVKFRALSSFQYCVVFRFRKPYGESSISLSLSSLFNTLRFIYFLIFFCVPLKDSTFQCACQLKPHSKIASHTQAHNF